ncbi:TRAP transporter large permease [Advenella sp. FME57]|uniref:TRAP transporter large permease n=1 Tax=Advenella sp. FME57 TaxID=2742604 RepID=UPI001867ED95|nr:TRAP transporter large permease [Advenella sp. FME57]
MIVSLLLLLLVIGTPIGIAFALIVMVNAESWNIDPFTLAALPYDTVNSFPLLAIPLYLLVGELMNRGGLVAQIISVCDIFLSKVRAPLGHIMIFASALMGAITGSSVATVAAIGSTVGSEMRKRGYPVGYVAALNAAAGLLGVLIPPSIPLILYGSIVGVSITKLFMASLIPGLLIIVVFCIIHLFLSRRVLKDGQEVRTEDTLPDIGAVRRPIQTVVHAAPALFLPVLVLGGIYSGIFTPTEAAAVAGVYAMLVTLISRKAGKGDMRGIFEKAVLATAAILVIIAFTSVFNRAMVLEQIPQGIADFTTAFTSNPMLFLLVVNIALILVGMFMETNAATLLMGPLLAPAAIRFGVDPVHFGVILVTNIEIGLLTPPLAANLYVAARTNNARLSAMMQYTWWFLGGTLLALMLITFIPQLTMWPNYFKAS